MNYECHITFEDNNYGEAVAKKSVEFYTGWKFSKIDGDPVLGTGTRFYATQNYPKTMRKQEVLLELHKATSRIEMCDFPVIRQKIEVVIFDTKE